MNTLDNIYKTYSLYTIISTVVILSYLPTFTGGFILDDNDLIKNNKYITEIHSISSYLSQEDGVPDQMDLGVYHSGYYRPLMNLFYYIDYKVWGMKANGFRTTNVILHILCCIILFQLITLLLKDTRAAFWATFLFAVHPVNSESISFIISRNNIVVTIFILFSLYCYIISWEKGRIIPMVLAFISFTGAVFSKEFGITALPVIFIYHRLLSQRKKRYFQEIISYIPFIFILVIYFTLRSNVIGSSLSPFKTDQYWYRIFFVPYLIVWNLRLIFIPHELHIFNIFYPSSIFKWQAIIPIGIFCVISYLIWSNRKNKILLFSCFSFFISISPVLNLVASASDTPGFIAMRWLYLPMTFIILWIAWYIKKIFKVKKTITTILLCIGIVYFCVYSYILNRTLWYNEETLYQQEILHYKNYRFAGGYANILLDKKRYREAEKYFMIAINKYPNNVNNYINYAFYLIEIGRPDVAISYLYEAKQLSMTNEQHGHWFNNMGMAMSESGDQKGALKNFKKAVIFAPRKGEFWANLGSTYGSNGDYENAVIALKKGLTISPDLKSLQKNLALTYRNMKNSSDNSDILKKTSQEQIEADENI
ncbi:MAG: glycosyltransferase family 39 protein [Deltaproteobacteria bacterium]|nr:glycosyltransferase family 39 protein [Deltaproteobacteria bacterium]